MELLFNDRSLHGQFEEISTFRDAIGRIMRIRETARRFGRQLPCHRNVASAQVTRSASMPQAVQWLSDNERRALMQWLTREGPFWEETRDHDPGDYLEWNEEVVTDTAIGEAAYRCFHGLDYRLVSVIPSSWQFSPVTVTWHRDANAVQAVAVSNYWDPGEMEAILQTAPVPVRSWEKLETIVTARCPNLRFLPSAFERLRGLPFHAGAAERILVLLDTLHRLRACVDGHGQRTAEGHRIYQDHFTGDKAWFSDSSDSEWDDFATELTFLHPVTGAKLECRWHGKVKTPQLRIHFTWPVGPAEALYVVYVGPKLTKR